VKFAAKCIPSSAGERIDRTHSRGTKKVLQGARGWGRGSGPNLHDNFREVFPASETEKGNPEGGLSPRTDNASKF